MKKWFLISFCLLLAGCATSGSKSSPAKTPLVPEGAVASKAVVPQIPVTQTVTPETGKEDKIVKIKIETTLGDIYADLNETEAPKTVENFVTLAQKGFYDGIIFHRVIPNFMIQTGDPTGTGMGGPGYQFKDEFSKKLRHDKAGVLSMANSGPNTNGSQFFITDKETPHLDDHHSVFGHVTEGIDVVHKIARVPTLNDRPVQKVAMTKVTVIK